MPLCDACRRREAFYLRTYSGEKLCAACLERSLVKAIRRALGRSGLLKPRASMLVPLSLYKPSFALALSRLLVQVEKSYGGNVILAVPANIYDASKLPNTGATPLLFELHIEPGLPASPVGCARLDRRWAIQAAKLAGADTVILPLTRTDLNLMMLHSFLEEGVVALSEAAPWLDSESPSIVSGLWTIEAEAVMAYAFSRDLVLEPACLPDASLAKDVFYSIAGRRPELEFSSLKSIRLLLGSVRASLRLCPLCRGFTRSEGACSYCSPLSVRVTPLSAP